MGRFIDCQMAIVPWGEKAKYRRARVGLLRKASTIYIAMFFNATDTYKFQIDDRSIELLPAAIRLKDLKRDLFIRQVSDEQRYATMVREIKVILKREKLRQSGKAHTLDKLISSIPPLTAFKSSELLPARVSARLIVDTTNNNILAASPLHQHRSANATGVGDDFIQIDCDGTRESDCVFGNDDGIVHELPARRSLVAYDDHNKAPWFRNLENRQLQSIKISGLDNIPKQLWLRTSLHQLTLTDCNLTIIPKQLEFLSRTLTSLDLSNNRIRDLPRSFCCKMNCLEALNLNNNLIGTLPIEIKFFRKLIDLNISNNRLRMLPSTFSDLRSLEKLNVANNNLSQLPAFGRDEIRLRHLDVSHNPLDGALNEASTFEVYPSSVDDTFDYKENIYCPLSSVSKRAFPTLFEISMLNIVRCDKLLKIASEESLPRTIVSIMQRDIFKCYKCSKMNILPAYNSTDILDYVGQVEVLQTTGNYRYGMTFMKLLCRNCFDNMSS